MNSAQRKRARKKWLRDNNTEIELVLNWLKAEDLFVLGWVGDDFVEMIPEKIKAFGSSYSCNKSYWREYLEKRGVGSQTNLKFATGK